MQLKGIFRLSASKQALEEVIAAMDCGMYIVWNIITNRKQQDVFIYYRKERGKLAIVFLMHHSVSGVVYVLICMLVANNNNNRTTSGF